MTSKETRSIKIEDIESVSSYNKENAGYGKKLSPRDGYYYPNIYEDEMSGTINGIGRSEQNEYITGYSSATSYVTGVKTEYYYELSTTYMNEAYVELFYYQLGTIRAYWLASRMLSCGYNGNDDDYCLYYGMSFVNSNYLNSGMAIGWLYYANNEEPRSITYAIRPIVEIDLSNVTIGETGTGTRTSPYSIVAK